MTFNGSIEVLADELHGGGDVRILDGLHVCRAARDHALRRDEDIAIGRPPARHQTIQQGGGLVTLPPTVSRNAAQGDLAELARDFVVLEADQRHVLRHAQPEAQTGVENHAGSMVVDGHHAHGAFQRLEPLFERFHPAMPRMGDAEVARHFEHRAISAALPDPLDKALLSLLRVPYAVLSKVARSAEPAFQQMLGGQAAHRLLVDRHAGELDMVQGGRQVDHRHAERLRRPQFGHGF